MKQESKKAVGRVSEKLSMEFIQAHCLPGSYSADERKELISGDRSAKPMRCVGRYKPISKNVVHKGSVS
eukprot:910292-Rhodomonas_salina.1